MTHDEAMRYRLTPDFTMRPHRQPTPGEYKLSLKILHDYREGRGGQWHDHNLSDVEHDVLMSLYRAGLIEQNKRTYQQRLTKLGEVYFMQRQSGPARDRKRACSTRRDVDTSHVLRYWSKTKGYYLLVRKKDGGIWYARTRSAETAEKLRKHGFLSVEGAWKIYRPSLSGFDLY